MTDTSHPDVKSFSVIGKDNRELNIVVGPESAQIVTHAMGRDNTEEDRVLVCQISRYELIGLAYDILNTLNVPATTVVTNFSYNKGSFPGIPNPE